MKFLAEQLTRFDIVEAAQKPKGVIMQIRGKFGHAGKITENGRYYSRSIMEREIARLQPKIMEKAVIGEADHPGLVQGGAPTVRQSSFIITGLAMNDDGEIMGEADIVDTAAGRDLAALIRAGAQVGVSSRGKGESTRMKMTSDHPDFELNKAWDGKAFESVDDSFVLRSFDSVIGQAVEDAYFGDYRESKEDIMDLDKILKDPDLMKKILESEEAKKFIDQVVEAATKKKEEELDKKFESDVKEAVMSYIESDEFNAKFVVDKADDAADALEEAKCPECEGGVPKGAKFCPACGVRVQAAKKAEQTDSEKDVEIKKLKEENAKIVERMARLEQSAKDADEKKQIEAIVGEALKDQIQFIVENVRKDIDETVLTPKNAKAFVERRVSHYRTLDEAVGGAFSKIGQGGDGRFVPNDSDDPAGGESKPKEKARDLLILESIP